MSKVKSPTATFENQSSNDLKISQWPLSEAEISQIEFNMSLTPEERLRNHERALRMMLELRKAAEEADIEDKS